MGLTDPQFSTSKALSDVLREGEPFRLLGIRVVSARTRDYGEGEMVLLKVAGQSDELSIWGTYLVEQAKAADNGDFGKDYTIERRVVAGYSDKPVKQLVPVNVPAAAPAPRF